jgi:Fe-S cluster biogenesis protein NfuA
MVKKIEEVLTKIRPSLQADGGDIELVSFEDGVVNVRLKGACGGCPMSQLTLKGFVEQTLKSELDGIKEVRAL